MLARILAILLTTSYILLATPAFAQAPVPTPDPSTTLRMGLPSNVSPTSPLYTDLLVNNLFHSFSCLAIGQSVIGQPCLTYQITKNAEGMIQSVPVLSQVNLSGGTLGAVTSVIGALYMNPPVRTADYLASVGQGLGIVKEAHAQVGGSGANVLSPILSLWQVSRNISYVLMIIIFLVIGLMIMFRNRINPQTVITAQAALPGLVIGLILITFSYFLAGLISDMAFVGTNVVGYYFTAAQGKDPQNLVEDMKNQNVLSIVSPFTTVIDQSTVTNALNSVWGSLDEAAKRLLTLLGVFVTAQITTQGTEWLKMFPTFGAPVQAIIIAIASATTAVTPTTMIGVALTFIATAILLYAMFKLLLRLVNAYLTIVFLTLTAPFQLLAAALPGRQGIATSWILNMLANILAFPAVIAVLYFVAFILGPDFIKPPLTDVFKVSQLNQTEQNTFAPVAYAQGTNSSKITGTANFPLFGGMDISFINLLLAFGALVALPSIPDIIGRTIGRMSQVGQMIGQEIGGGVAQGRQYAGQFQQGVGAGSQQLAQARGAFGTPAYIPSDFDEHGKPTGWTLNPLSYQPSALEKFQARKVASSGGLKKSSTGGYTLSR